MEPWYKIVTPRKEVREGRSFDPDQFAIALEQVVAGTAPEDYREPRQFFSRTCWTRALGEHVGMVLKRLAGKTESTPPVVTLVTQFGGGKDAHLNFALSFSKYGEGRSRLQRRCHRTGRSRIKRGARGKGGGLCRKCLGPTRRARNTLDRHRSAARRRSGRRGTRASGKNYAARDGNNRETF